MKVLILTDPEKIKLFPIVKGLERIELVKDAKGVVTSGMLSDPKVKAGLKIALGVLLPMVAGKGKLSGPVSDLSAGIATCGFLQLANATVLASNKVAISGNEWETLGYVPQMGAAFNQSAEQGTEVLGEF